ncbi:MAG: chromosomal replication initiator protein DnaA [Candidatus Melainabacteria bacterium]|nr:chromosomal replication initiator protein DnaA [Candidatus Melainabacteria bacterium]
MMNYELEKIWSDVQGHLSREMKGPSFQTWIKPSKLIELINDRAIIAVKNEFNKNFLKQYYFDKIAACIEKTIKRKILLEIVVKGDLSLNEFIPSIANLKESEKQENKNEGIFDHTFKFKSNLNPSYTFESFVVGTSNQFCHAAALAVAEAHAELYNPLFIYGGVGLGKTHLVHAIANYTQSQNKSQIKYLSSESFTNELIHSIRTDSMNKFREKYRQVDLLMIDDVQFLAGKEATQEEFFHTFNTLRENGKQIILTADRPPSSLSSITDRLKNRFEGGLIADIQFPDLETRIAILLLKAAKLNIDLQIDVAEYIAAVFSNNIRELEGALKRVHAYLSFTQEELNLKNVQKVLSSTNSSSSVKPSPDSILKTVASFYNTTYEDLISPKRSSDLTLPRHVAIYILHDYFKFSFPRIGELLSNRTHSSAIYAYQQIKKKLAKDSILSEQVNSLRGLLERRKSS